MKKIKKLTALVLSVLMVMSVFSVVSSGAYTGVEFYDYGNGTYGGTWVHTDDEEETGKGDGTWFLDENGVLTVSGWGNFNADHLFSKFPYEVDADECDYCMKLTESYDYNEEIGEYEQVREWEKTKHRYPLTGKIKKIVFSEGITQIDDIVQGNGVDGGLSFVEEIVLPESLLNIGDVIAGNASINIPKNCVIGGTELTANGLVVKEINIDENSPYYSTDDDGNIYNKDKTVLYRYMSSDKTFTVPDTVKEIEQHAFLNNLSLKSITIPGSVKKVNDYAFSTCFNLENVFIEKGVESIGRNAFGICCSLESINIPSTITEIGIGAFFGCWSLEEITVCSHDVSLSPGDVGLVNFEYSEEAISLVKEYLITVLKIESSGCNEYDSKKYDNAIFEAQCLKNQLERKLEEEGIDPFGSKVYISDILTIYCNEGSTAEAYAIENGIKYAASACEHSFGEWVADEANGVRYKTCSKCGKTYEEELEADDDTIDIEGNEGDNKFTVKLIENPESTEYIYIRGLVEGNIVALYDINLLDENGNKVQPDGTVKVSLPLGADVTYFTVLRINDDGTLTDMKAVREGDSVVFETDHFSYYVILGGETEDDTGDNIKCNCFCHSHPVFEIIVKIFKLLTEFFGGPLTFACDC
ncbi:MAG: leucine-rich repeat domain-containing protein [Ruminococcaceae bacterium]|nr:leucine-rich repeat domain-containing protein [Oscillospiraceae bacterium]